MFDINKLKVIKLSNDSCYSDKLRDIFKTFKIEKSEEGPADIMCMVQNYKGNPELFFNDIFKYCSSSNYFTEKVGQCHGALLIQEASLHLMKHLSDNVEEVNSSKRTSRTEKERFGLQYLGGYFFHRIYEKLRNSKGWQSQNNTSRMAIFRAGKCDTDDRQILVNVKNRGVLWLLTDSGQNLFENLKHLFRENTSVFKTKIQYDQETLQILKDPSINAYYSNMVDSADMKVEEETSDNLLEVIIGLYIRVRCHSYAKDIKEKEKVKRKSI